MLYALLAADEALRDASWLPSTPQQRRATGVCLGNGMSCTAEVAEAGRIILVRGGAGRGRAGGGTYLGWAGLRVWRRQIGG